jgi:hypothetical protein
MPCRVKLLTVLPGASLLLNMCANVPDSATPEICQSLMKTVGYKKYLIGEREVCTCCISKLLCLPAAYAFSGMLRSRIPAVRALVIVRRRQP